MHYRVIWGFTELRLNRNCRLRYFSIVPSDYSPRKKLKIPTIPGIEPEIAVCEAVTLRHSGRHN